MSNHGLFPWAEKLASAVAAVSAEFSAEGASSTSAPSATRQPTSKVVKKSSDGSNEPDLVAETPKLTPVIEVPRGVLDQKGSGHEEQDWELLSEKVSNCSTGGGTIFVPRAGSVRSITSIDHDNSSSSHATLSVPFKIQRTASSSTIDSQDNALGPSGKGVLGVDYVEHIVLPTDTLQGICIAYKVSVVSLRRANHFTGQLHSAPKKLLIPLSKQALRTGYIRVQDTDTKEYKLSFFQAEFADITPTEAKAYLELADWDLKEAIRSMREDREWEKEDGDKDDFKAGQIGIKINFKGGRPKLKLKGVGQSSKGGQDDKGNQKEKVVIHSKPPAIATKSLLPKDLCNAAPQDGTIGVELKSFSK
eukprot:scaffold5024_cov136-Cylindrotheca_fusiformis.AAC.7